MILEDRPSEVLENSVLRSSIDLGPFAFDEVYELEVEGVRLVDWITTLVMMMGVE